MDGVLHNYIYASGKLLRETYGNNVLDFFYDSNGTPFALKYNGTLYYYITNLQGDVINLVDANGTVVATYDYDPFGNVIGLEGTMATTNPLRYRGYYYDSELGLYYLQSRYYDPELCRFISADDVTYLGADGTILSNNLFAYCGNNPISGFDPYGYWDWDFWGKAVITTVIVAAMLTGVGFVASAVATAAAVSTTTAVTTAVTTAGISTVCSAIDGAICAEKSGGDWRDGAMAGAIGGAAGALVSTLTSPTAGADTALRMNVAGRVTSSFIYDITYDLFDSGKLTSKEVAGYSIDVAMDATLAPINYYYTGSISNGYIRSGINGIIDGAIDVFQTIAYFTE